MRFENAKPLKDSGGAELLESYQKPINHHKFNNFLDIVKTLALRKKMRIIDFVVVGTAKAVDCFQAKATHAHHVENNQLLFFTCK